MDRVHKSPIYTLETLNCHHLTLLAIVTIIAVENQGRNVFESDMHTMYCQLNDPSTNLRCFMHAHLFLLLIILTNITIFKNITIIRFAVISFSLTRRFCTKMELGCTTINSKSRISGKARLLSHRIKIYHP